MFWAFAIANSLGAAAEPAVTLPLDHVVMVALQRTPEHGGVDFHLCDDRNCSSLYVYGNTADMELAHEAYQQCDIEGLHCDKTHHNVRNLLFDAHRDCQRTFCTIFLLLFFFFDSEHFLDLDKNF